MITLSCAESKILLQYEPDLGPSIQWLQEDKTSLSIPPCQNSKACVSLKEKSCWFCSRERFSFEVPSGAQNPFFNKLIHIFRSRKCEKGWQIKGDFQLFSFLLPVLLSQRRDRVPLDEQSRAFQKIAVCDVMLS